jgi:pentatricopeptide repeat protein
MFGIMSRTINARMLRTSCHRNSAISIIFRSYSVEKEFSEYSAKEYSKLLLSLVQDRGLNKGLEFFRKIPHHLLATPHYNILIGACTRQQNLPEAMNQIEQMISNGFKPDVYTLNTVLSALFRMHDFENGMRVFNIMNKISVSPNEITFIAMIDGYGNAGQIKDAENVFYSLAQQHNISNSGNMGAAMMEAYNNNDMRENATQVFNNMPEKTIICYNTMLKFAMEDKNQESANEIIQQIQQAGLSFDEFTYATILTLYNKVGQYEEVISLYEQMIQKNITPNESAYVSLFQAYCRTDQLEKARKLFDQYPKMKHLTFGNLIDAYVKFKDKTRLFSALSEAEKGEFKLDKVTINIMINAYTKIDKSYYAKQLLFSMKKIFGHDPDLYSYSAVIKKFIRERNYTQAEEVMKHMFKNGVHPNKDLMEFVARWYNHDEQSERLRQKISEWRQIKNVNV